jgi:predicted NUDIX family NTP pyrophosphohydrolase
MKRSAGILLYRSVGELEVLLVHPGGPYWANKDAGAWSIPKGEYQPEEDAQSAARREFEEELGSEAPNTLHDLGTIRYKSGKEVICFAAVGNLDVSTVVSNTIQLEWPPKSGIMIDIPEVDRAEWCPLATARMKLMPAQCDFLTRLEQYLATT